MKTYRIATMVALSLSLASVGLRGQGAVPESLKQIAPFTDAYTVVVARADLGELDFETWQAAALEVVPQEGAKAAEAVAPLVSKLAAWQKQFLDAGAREIYAIVSLSYLSTELPMLLVVPVPAGGNAERIQGLMREATSDWDGPCRVIGDCVMAAPTSVWRVMESVGERQPPEHLETAFAGAPPGIAQAVLLTYPEAEKVLAEMLPILPEVLGGGPSASGVGGSPWVALSLKSPPDAALQMVVQFELAREAEAVGQLVGRGLAALGEWTPVRERLSNWKAIQAALTPRVAENTLRFRLDQSRITELMRQVVVPAAQQSKDRARRVVIMNDLKQVALAMHLYASEHQDQFPMHMADALPYLGSGRPLLLPESSVSVPEDLLQQDRATQVEWVEQHTDFIYALPGASVKSVEDPARAVLAYQKPETSSDGSVGIAFADGHVEILAREALAKLLP